MKIPSIIQGGMGVAVSGWRLARTVSEQGHLGVVSGTLLPVVLARRLQLGDEGGHMERAAREFPDPALVERIFRRYFIPGGKAATAPFAALPMPSGNPSRQLHELTVLSNFIEVRLAKEGHGGMVGINLLEKIQVATLASLFGAMLAGVDVVLMGAGIPRAIPAVLDAFADGRAAEITLDVTGNNGCDPVKLAFDPARVIESPPATLHRPAFLAIVSSDVLATTLARKASGRVDGFIVESPAAGGHNAPPRGTTTLDDAGEPVYGPRDIPDLEKFRKLGLPFWLAGERASHDSLQSALAQGAEGVQIGTAFAFCEESGLDPALKARVLESSRAGKVRVFTDPAASPTGFPFKVVRLEGTLSEQTVYENRMRVCDLGYLRETYRRENGSLGFRCPAEPGADFVAKGGSADEFDGRKCLCNGLLAAVGLGQTREGVAEPPILTAGNATTEIAAFLQPGANTYSAADVLRAVSGGA